MKAFIIATLASAGLMSPGDVKAVVVQDDDKGPDAVTDRAFNVDLPWTLAQHRSHSSHRSHGSHGSHRSSSQPAPRYPSTAPSAPRQPAPAPRPSPSRNERSTPNSSVLPGSPNTAPTENLYGQSNEFKLLTMRVQLALLANGYYNGAIDGIIGSETRASITKYQSDKGLSVTGTLSDELVKSLNIPAE